jgi:hypothetical protein
MTPLRFFSACSTTAAVVSLLVLWSSAAPALADGDSLSHVCAENGVLGVHLVDEGDARAGAESAGTGHQSGGIDEEEGVVAVSPDDGEDVIVDGAGELGVGDALDLGGPVEEWSGGGGEAFDEEEGVVAVSPDDGGDVIVDGAGELGVGDALDLKGPVEEWPGDPAVD